MENSTKPQDSAIPTDPKPTDQVQLAVETVIPDTEEILPAENDRADNDEHQPEKEQQQDNNAEANPESEHIENKEVGDERDQVETVSP